MSSGNDNECDKGERRVSELWELEDYYRYERVTIIIIIIK